MKKYKDFSQIDKSINPLYEFIDKCIIIINHCPLKSDIKTFENEYLKIISDNRNDNLSVFIKEEKNSNNDMENTDITNTINPDILIQDGVLKRAFSSWHTIEHLIDLIVQESTLDNTLKNKEKSHKSLKI